MITAIGVLMTQLGHNGRHEIGPDWRTRLHGWRCSADELRSSHTNPLRVDVDHTHEWIGQVRALRRSTNGDVWAIAEVDADRLLDLDEHIYFSASVLMTPEGRDIELTSAALTLTPCGVCMPPVDLYPGGINRRGSWSGVTGIRSNLIEQAAAIHYADRNAPLAIRDERLERLEGRSVNDPAVREYLEEQHWQRRGPVRHWPATHGSILSVR